MPESADQRSASASSAGPMPSWSSDAGRMSVIRLRIAWMLASTCSIAWATASGRSSGFTRASAPRRSFTAASSCRLSSCSSRAQRRRSSSEASTLRSRACVSTVWAVATAVAALAANASMRRSSSALNSGPPVDAVERRHHAHRPVAEHERHEQTGVRPDPFGEPEAQPSGSVGEAFGAARPEDLAAQ